MADSVALRLYDMGKAASEGLLIESVCLTEKTPTAGPARRAAGE